MSNLQDIKTFIQASMNLDDDSRALKPNEFRRLINFYSQDGKGKNMPGNTIVDDNYVFYHNDYRLRGWCEDVNNKAFIMFLDGTSDGIYRYYIETGVVEVILRSDVTPEVDSILNFQEDYWINANVIDDLLYWTDNYETEEEKFEVLNYNPPRKINMTKAKNYMALYDGFQISYYKSSKVYVTDEYTLYNKRVFKARKTVPVITYPPANTNTHTEYWLFIQVYDVENNYLNMTYQILDRIKYPPLEAPTMLNEAALYNGKVIEFENGIGTDTSLDSNNIRTNLFQASYRYVYDDNEKSVWSPITDLFIPPNTELVNGAYLEDVSVYNTIGFSIGLGPLEVTKIEIAVRNHSKDDFWKLIDVIYKYDDNDSPIDGVVSNTDYDYFFYNDIEGDVLEQAKVYTLYDDVPQISKGEELIEKNRIVDSNYIKGYDNIDVDVGLDFGYTRIAIENTVINYSLNLVFGSPDVLTAFITSAIPNALYELTVFFSKEGCPTVLEFITSTWQYTAKSTDTVNDIAAGLAAIGQKNPLYTVYLNNPSNYIYSSGSTVVVNGYISGCPTGPGTVRVGMFDGNTCLSYLPVEYEYHWKLGAWEKLGLVYYDRAQRASSVVSEENCRIYNPTLDELVKDGTITTNSNLYKSELSWEINHQPPPWATHYQWVLTDNSIEWFDYYLIYGSDITATSGTRILININESVDRAKDGEVDDEMIGSNLKYYQWQKGDRIRFLMHNYTPTSTLNQWDYPLSGTKLDFEIRETDYNAPAGDNYGYLKDDVSDYVLDVDGNKVRNEGFLQIVIQKFDISSFFTLSADEKIVVEIYRPKKSISDDENEFYYGFSPMYDVLVPHGDVRVHAGPTQDQSLTHSLPATGTFSRGDMYARGRFDGRTMYYPCESNSVSDFYDSDAKNFGKPNIKNINSKRQRFISNLCFSGTYIQDTLVNDLSKVKFEDFVPLPEKFGEINNIEEIGITLKVRQDSKSHSIYIGRSVIEQANNPDNPLISASTKVLGTIMTSQDRWGTLDQQSCIHSLRYEYFVDVLNGVIIRDAPNGMYPISEYKVRKFVKDKCDFLLKDCSYYRILAGIDTKNNHVYFTFIGLPKGESDYNIETIIFNETEDKWIFMIELALDYYEIDSYMFMGENMFSFYNNELFEHNTRDDSNYYQTDIYPKVNLVVNNDPTKIKVMKSMGMYTNAQWAAPVNGDISVPADLNHSNGMSSKLPLSRWRNKEGVWYVPFARNMKTRQSTETMADFVNGEPLRGEVMDVSLTCETNDSVEVSTILINNNHSKKSGVKR